MDPIPMAGSFPATTCEVEEAAECLRKNLRTSTSTSKQQTLKPMPQPSKDHISVLLSTTDVYEVVEHEATKMASGLVVSDNGAGGGSSRRRRSGGGDSSSNNNFGSQVDCTFVMPRRIKDMVNGGGDICELAAQVAIQVTDGLQLVPVTSPAAQGGANNDNHDDDLLSINIDPINEEPPTTVLSSVQLSQALMTVALLTMAIDVGTVLYKPARGALFSHNKLAYYLTLVGIFIAGVAEALIAVWLSRSHQVDKHCFSFGRAVLCALLAPFVAIVGIGGFAFVEG